MMMTMMTMMITEEAKKQEEVAGFENLADLDLGQFPGIHFFHMELKNDLLTFKTRIQVSNYYSTTFHRVATDSKCSSFFKQVGPIATALTKPLVGEGGIDGIKDVTFHQYDFVIDKAELFSWDELIPQIIEAIRTSLNIKLLLIIQR
jgi:hypothetical protein